MLYSRSYENEMDKNTQLRIPFMPSTHLPTLTFLRLNDNTDANLEHEPPQQQSLRRVHFAQVSSLGCH